MSDRNQRKYRIEKILTDPNRMVTETRGVGGILARLWREMLKDLSVSPNRFEILLSDYIANARRNAPDNRVARRLTRGNLRRALENDAMTLKVFVQAAKLLKIPRFTMTFELEHSTGRRTSHKFSIEVETTKSKDVGHILAELRYRILSELNISETRFELLLSNYISSAKRGLASTRNPRHLTRAGWKRELDKDAMTFKTLVKLFKFLNVRRFTLVLEAIQMTGLLTRHTTAVDLGEPTIQIEIFTDPDEDDKQENPPAPTEPDHQRD